MKKIISSALACCLAVSCASVLAACAKQDQANKLEFTGVAQAASGDVYLKIDNIGDYGVNTYIECTVDGGKTWKQALYSTGTFLAMEYSEDAVNTTLKIGVRMGETDDKNASAASSFIEYKVKPVSEVKEIFYMFGNSDTSDYSVGKGRGNMAYKLILQPDKSAKIEKFHCTEYTEEYSYDYTFVPDNWDKTSIAFEYKYVSAHDAFDRIDADLHYNHEFIDNENFYETDGWKVYNPALGITPLDYTGRLETIPAVNMSVKAFTVLIRAKGSESVLRSHCSPVYTVVEEIEELR